MRRRVLGLLVLVLAVVALVVGLLRPRVPWQAGAGNQVGVVEVVGPILSTADPWSPDAADVRDVLDQLETARTDQAIRAVVVRIDSPGGTPAASQELREALQRVREAGKPVVASLGDVAASGGYYVATGADRIVANPGTLTGSIGVIFQVFTVHELLDRWGVQVNVVQTGRFKDTGSPFRPLDPLDRQFLEQLAQDVLDQFVQAVVEGRGLPEEEVRELADGRVFSGRQALELGLVDQLGGLDAAVSLAARLAGIEGEPEVRRLRRPRTLFEELVWGLARLIPSRLGARIPPALAPPGGEGNPSAPPLPPAGLPRLRVFW